MAYDVDTRAPGSRFSAAGPTAQIDTDLWQARADTDTVLPQDSGALTVGSQAPAIDWGDSGRSADPLPDILAALDIGDGLPAQTSSEVATPAAVFDDFREWPDLSGQPFSATAGWAGQTEVTLMADFQPTPMQGCCCAMCGDDRSMRSPAPGDTAGGGIGPVGSAGPAASLQTLANYLREGFWDDFSGGDPYWFDLGSGANDGVLYYNVTGWTGTKSTVYGDYSDSNGISDARKVLARAAFDVYEAVLGINFVETTANTTAVDFFFTDTTTSTAFAASELNANGTMDYAVINISSNWSGSSSNIGGTNGYTFQTFLHEIGHALGLGHQGLYNAGSGTITFTDDAQWLNDSWLQTMMSYFDQDENTLSPTDSYAQLVSPMAVDWIALNDLYASQGYGTANAFSGDTIYGVGTNITAATSAAFAGLAGFADTNAFTIVDGSGIDTIDFSTYANNQKIDLRFSSADNTQATLSSVGGLTSNMTIAVGTVIENATTGTGNDTLHGNDVDNVLVGNAGDDHAYGGDGSDILQGGIGNDRLQGGLEVDTVYGGTGNDLIEILSGEFADDVYGGDGTDTLDLSQISGPYLFGGSQAASVNLDTGLFAALGNPNGAVSGIESVSGTQENDTLLSGGTGGITLSGNGGDDVISGGMNAQTLFGGAGNDVLFGDGLTPAGSSTADMMDGGSGNDTLEGANGGDTILGGDDNDFILGDRGLSGGADSLNGGNGRDTVSYSTSNLAVNVRLNSATNTGGHAQGDTLSGFEVLIGSAFNDTLDSGGADGGEVFGNIGNDLLTGGSGSQHLYGGDGDDTLLPGEVTNGDQVFGGAGDDSIRSGLGSEVMDGGTGTDVIDLRSNNETYVFNMETGETNVPGEAYTNFEIAYMGTGNDSIIGTSVADTIFGGEGNDTISGGFDVDDLYGDEGDDRFNYVSGEGYDNLYGGDGVDSAYYEPFFSDALVINMVTNRFNVVGEVLNLVFDSVENVQTSTGADRVIGSSAANRIEGGANNDTLMGYDGNDTLDGGDGDDSLNGGIGDDSIRGGTGNDIVVTGAGADSHEGGAGNDSLNGGADDDVLDGGTDNDTLVGAAGQDSLTGGLGIDSLQGGGGNDTLTGDDGDDVLDGGQDADTVEGGVGNDLVKGGGGDDEVYGDIGDDSVDGGSGADVLSGGDGNDWIYIDNQGDTVIEAVGGGHDRVFAKIGLSLLTLGGELEDLTLLGTGDISGTGNTLDNTIIGTIGKNNLQGGDGNDTLNGGDGDDSLSGGTGADSVNGGEGNDTMTGGTGQDTLSGSIGDDVMNGGLDNDNLTGGDGNDDLTGSFGDDSLSGSNGNDALYGGANNDTLLGGADNDSMSGGADNDLLNGGSGNDTQSGGTGADTFVFSGAFGVDSILDFALAELGERIDLSEVTSILDFADLQTGHLSQSGADALITSGLNTITLVGIQASSLTADDFIF